MTPQLKNSQPNQNFQQYESLTQHLLQALLGDSERLVVVSEKSGKLQIDIEVPDEFKGHVIGKGGRIARSLRSIIDIAPFDYHHPTIVNIID